MSDHFERDPVADQLRASLAAHAAAAPRGDSLAEQIITAVPGAAGPPRRPSRRWRTWTLPLIAAGAVAGVVVAVAEIQSYHHTAAAPGGPLSASVALPSSQPTVPTPTTPVPVTTTTPSVLHGVQVLDLTFVSDDSGWALASADCAGAAGRCTALLRTSDGIHWRSTPNTPFNVPGIAKDCADPCVSHIRFANERVGYLFGPDALLMTIDGGQSWSEQTGGAIALESLNGNVIRVTSSGTGCPGPCDVGVQTAAIGSERWVPAKLGPLSGATISFARGGSDAYLLVGRNPAGGADDATSSLYRSMDDGQTWLDVGEPCPQLNGEVDGYQVAGGTGDHVSVLCAQRFPPQRWFVATSRDAGATFVAQPGTVPSTLKTTLLAGDPLTVLVVGGHGMARSTDSGRTWRAVPDVVGDLGFVGFESANVGRAVSADGVLIWTTRDGGATWQATKAAAPG